MLTIVRRSRSCAATTAVACLSLAVLARAAGAAEYVFHAVPPIADAAITVDGRPAGQVDADGYALLDGFDAGTHSVALHTGDGRTWGPHSVTFDSVVNALEPFDTTQPSTANVIFDTNIAGATISIAGRRVAVTGNDGSATVTLLFGTTNRVTIAKAGFTPATITIVAGPNRNASVRLNAIIVTPPSGMPRGVAVAAFVLALLIVAAASALVFLLLRERRKRPPKRSRTQPLPSVISFDRYRLTDVLGSGGLATVYRATDAVDGTLLALKILEQKWIDDPEMVQKFFAEAEALEAIRGVAPEAAVVRCLASGREGGRVTGRPFIAMELLDGYTLEESLDRDGALPETIAAAVGAQIGWALSGAHESGVIHRDLTPDNIFLLEEKWRGCGGIAPRVVLIDFGVARVEVLSKRTLEISVSGKPGYMAPEQTRGHIATPQMDLYAFGVILYQMVAGRPPFTAGTPDELMRMHAESEAPELPPHVSEQYRQLVRMLMAKDSAARPASAMVVAGRLEIIAEGTWSEAFDQTIVASQARGGTAI